MKSYSYGTTPIDVLKKAINNEFYSMTLVGEDSELMVEIINQGIDSHLEAFTESTFNGNENRLICNVSPKDMLVLLRRLEESDNENACFLRIGILETLDIEEI